MARERDPRASRSGRRPSLEGFAPSAPRAGACGHLRRSPRLPKIGERFISPARHEPFRMRRSGARCKPILESGANVMPERGSGPGQQSLDPVAWPLTRGMGILPVEFSDTGWKPVPHRLTPRHGHRLAVRASCLWSFRTRAGSPCHTEAWRLHGEGEACDDTCADRSRTQPSGKAGVVDRAARGVEVVRWCRSCTPA